MKEKAQNRIDLVIPWVDGSDLAWRAEKARFDVSVLSDDREIRYRDWGVLQYLFRGLEKFAPWVGNVHFITWGHLPPWLNTRHPNLNIVNHKDYIPADYLPTFSANTIELNLHRINSLSEQFIYLNDDMFFLRPLSAEQFFRNGLPCDFAVMNPAYTLDLADANGSGQIHYFAYNDVNHLNCHFSQRESIRRHPLHWYNPVYGSGFLRNLLLSPWPRFVGFVDSHLPQPYLKSSFEQAWADSFDVLDATCRNRIRSDHDVNQWYIRYRQLAQGAFHPIRPYKESAYTLGVENSAIYRHIANQSTPMICINDSMLAADAFAREQANLQQAFEQILPEKSGFEL